MVGAGGGARMGISLFGNMTLDTGVLAGVGPRGRMRQRQRGERAEGAGQQEGGGRGSECSPVNTAHCSRTHVHCTPARMLQRLCKHAGPIRSSQPTQHLTSTPHPASNPPTFSLPTHVSPLVSPCSAAVVARWRLPRRAGRGGISCSAKSGRLGMVGIRLRAALSCRDEAGA